MKRIHSVLAATLKKERLNLHLTLKQLTEGICSISYGSKIENNLLVPDRHIMQLLFEKVNIDYDNLLSIEQTNDLELCVKCYLYRQYEVIADAYNNLNDKYFFTRNSLLKIIYYLTTRQYHELVVEFNALEDVKNTLDSYELLLLMILRAEYNIQVNKYHEAEQYLNHIKNIVIEDQDLQILYFQQRFIISFNLRDYYHLHDYYLKLKAIDYSLKNHFHINLLYLEAFVEDEKTLEILKNMEIDYIPDEFTEDFYYSKCLILIKLHQYLDVLNLIDERELFNIRFVALYGYCVKKLLDKDRNIEESKQFINNFIAYYPKMEYDNHDNIHQGFVKLMKMEIENEPRDNIYDYLKHYLLVEDYHHRFYSYYYAYKYLKVLGEKSRYKEAYLFTMNNPHLVCYLSEFE